MTSAPPTHTLRPQNSATSSGLVCTRWTCCRTLPFPVVREKRPWSRPRAWPRHFRHQDVQDKGQVSLVTQLIQLGTLLDNVGAEVPSRWVTRETIEGVNAMWPRTGWSACFRRTVEKEKQLKPFAMVSRIEGFEGLIMANIVTAADEGN